MKAADKSVATYLISRPFFLTFFQNLSIERISTFTVTYIKNPACLQVYCRYGLSLRQTHQYRYSSHRPVTEGNNAFQGEYSTHAWYRKLLFIRIYLFVVIQIYYMSSGFLLFYAQLITPNFGRTKNHNKFIAASSSVNALIPFWIFSNCCLRGL